MATPQLSPGLIVREVDLTVGRADNVLDTVGAIAGPFAVGPVEEPIDIRSEQELLTTFGKPISTDSQYEYWLSAASFLSYGGALKVVRVDGTTLNNSNAGAAGTFSTSLKIKNFDDYTNNYSSSNSFAFAAKNPGSWANNLKVCVIDDLADQIIGITTTNPGALGAVVGYGVTTALSSVALPGSGTTTSFTGYLKGIVTGVTTDSTNGNSSITVKILSRVSSANTETSVTYSQNNAAVSFEAADTVYFVNNSGITTGNTSATTVSDWYDQQTLGLTNSTVYWKSIAPKPVSNRYVLDRNGKNDGIHVVVVDDTGSVSGVQGNILEKYLSLSKSLDAVSSVNSPDKIWYRSYLANFSQYIYGGAGDLASSLVATGFATSFNLVSNSTWGRDSQGATFGAVGNVTFNLKGGVDYSASNGMTATLGSLSTAYDLFQNKDDVSVDYLIGGPSLSTEVESQAKANKLISIAELRKDCIAVVSPHKSGVVNQTNTTTQTTNILKFFGALSSSSFAVFDSGYKYTYDRFNNQFVYLPCNPDVAGLMARTSVNSYPWVSPAGLQRGALNNAIKLAYTPTKAQRDQLYAERINSIINQTGSGIVLFGDKTALSYQSAFDRINVRRLFITIEKALERAAQSQLFELNDASTRANFVNIVEPYLRDVQSKQGIYDFLVVCDQSNNTPDVIDNNEFRADIFLKPVKSINYITLTFVATRTGVSFEEVAGRV